MTLLPVPLIALPNIIDYFRGNVRAYQTLQNINVLFLVLRKTKQLSSKFECRNTYTNSSSVTYIYVDNSCNNNISRKPISSKILGWILTTTKCGYLFHLIESCQCDITKRLINCTILVNVFQMSNFTYSQRTCRHSFHLCKAQTTHGSQNVIPRYSRGLIEINNTFYQRCFYHTFHPHKQLLKYLIPKLSEEYHNSDPLPLPKVYCKVRQHQARVPWHATSILKNERISLSCF